MWIFSLYRLYTAIAGAVFFYLFVYPSIWLSILTFFFIRFLWFFIERTIKKVQINKLFFQHIALFKQEYGPYGIRLANKAEQNWRIKESLSEVFVSDIKKLETAVSHLEAMDALFNAGMRPEGDEFLMHDLKLKYGKARLEKEKSKQTNN